MSYQRPFKFSKVALEAGALPTSYNSASLASDPIDCKRARQIVLEAVIANYSSMSELDLSLECSRDGTTWSPVNRTPEGVGELVEIKHAVSGAGRYAFLVSVVPFIWLRVIPKRVGGTAETLALEVSGGD